MRYGDYQDEKNCHTKGVILTNDKGDKFTFIGSSDLDKYKFINERTHEIITVELTIVEEQKNDK